MLGRETICAADGCDDEADPLGKGTLHEIVVGTVSQFYVQVWLCPFHARNLKRKAKKSTCNHLMNEHDSRFCPTHKTCSTCRGRNGKHTSLCGENGYG